MAAVLNEVIAQAAALITWRSGPSKWQPQEAGCLSPPVGAQYPVISASHLEPSGHPCLGMAKGRPWPMCCWGRAVVGGKAAPSPASQVKSSSPVLRRGGGGGAGLFKKLRDLSSGVSAVQNACGTQALPSAALGMGSEEPKPGGPAALVWVRSGALCCEHPTQLCPALGLLSAWPSPEPPVSLREQKAGAPPPQL